MVRRIAGVLSIDPGAALHVAHLDRAPDELRRVVDLLRRQAELERAMRERTAEALFPLSLWNLLPGDPPRRTPGPPSPSPGASIVRALDQILDLARSTPDLDTYLGESRRLLAALPAKDRRRILEAAPAFAERTASSSAPRTRSGPRVVPAPAAGCPPDVLPGDSLLVEDGAPPGPGDLVLVEEAGGPAVRRWEPGVKGVRAVVVEVRRRLRRR